MKALLRVLNDIRPKEMDSPLHLASSLALDVHETDASLGASPLSPLRSVAGDVRAATQVSFSTGQEINPRIARFVHGISSSGRGAVH